MIRPSATRYWYSSLVGRHVVDVGWAWTGFAPQLPLVEMPQSDTDCFPYLQRASQTVVRLPRLWGSRGLDCLCCKLGLQLAILAPKLATNISKVDRRRVIPGKPQSVGVKCTTRILAGSWKRTMVECRRCQRCWTCRCCDGEMSRKDVVMERRGGALTCARERLYRIRNSAREVKREKENMREF